MKRIDRKTSIKHEIGRKVYFRHWALCQFWSVSIGLIKECFLFRFSGCMGLFVSTTHSTRQAHLVC